MLVLCFALLCFALLDPLSHEEMGDDLLLQSCKFRVLAGSFDEGEDLRPLCFRTFDDCRYEVL